MYKKFFISFSFLFSLVTIVICNLLWNVESQGTLYASQGVNLIQEIFFFFPLDKWALYGLPSFFSLFYHQDSKHLLFNIIFMIIVALPFEAKWGKIKTLYTFIFLHIISLYVSSFFFFSNSALSGLSLGTCALYSLHLTADKKYIKLLVLYLIIFISFENPLYTKIDVHLIAIIIGSVVALLKNKIKNEALPTKSS